MIIDSFDNQSRALIEPPAQSCVAKCDVVIVTFSDVIERYVVETFKAKQFKAPHAGS